MMRFDDYPYPQFRAAFSTLLGRVSLIALAVLVGSVLGGLTATRSAEGLWLGVVGLPWFSLVSLANGIGLFAFPALLFFAVGSIRGEWPLRLTLLCSILMWWNIHKTIRYTEFDSTMAKEKQEARAEGKRILDEAFRGHSEPRDGPRP